VLTLLLLTAIALCLSIAPLAAGAIGLGVGLGLGRKKKKGGGVVYPRLEVPYLSEQQIRGSPILSPMYDVWQQLAQTVGNRRLAPMLPPESYAKSLEDLRLQRPIYSRPSVMFQL
jgi:hypothetical protein